MVKSHCHTRDWIEAQRQQLGVADAVILERAILALTLLSALARSPLDFVFKGGTSLLLHLPRPLRLSIDIDVVCATSREELKPVLDALLVDTPFLRWEEHVRGEERLPRRLHFKFYFKSTLPPEREVPVLLDVVTEENRITDLVQKPVQLHFIETDDPAIVSTPSVNALLGDKMTAFAPNTVGVPLTERFSQQVIKQLFDVAQLYGVVTDMEAVARANQTSFEAERGYRGAEFTASYADYLSDVVETCRSLSAIDLKGFTESETTQLMRRGIGQLPNHLVGCRFRLPEAKVAAAKTAVLASLMTNDVAGIELPVYALDKVAALKTHELSESLRPLHRLKGGLPEAYFYWASVVSP